MNQSTRHTTDSTETIAPPDLGIFRLKPLMMILCGSMIPIGSFISAHMIQLIDRSYNRIPLYPLVGMILFILITAVIMIFFIPVVVHGLRICDGEMKMLLKSMKCEEVMTFDILEQQGRHRDEDHLVFRSFSGRTLAISDKHYSRADWEHIRAWAELHFTPGTQWLTHNFELYYKRNPEAHPERIAAKL